MELNDFIRDFADQFEETDSESIKGETLFHDLDEWDSLVALAVLNMSEKKYGKRITFDEMRSCETVEDLFRVVSEK